MRPARKGPENPPIRILRAVAYRASMRPARKGPENQIFNGRKNYVELGFNEAGPQGAGKPTVRRPAGTRATRLQ